MFLYREIISSELVCEKEEKIEVMSSDIDTPVRESHGSELCKPQAHSFIALFLQYI